jgi:hypothetical protein
MINYKICERTLINDVTTPTRSHPSLVVVNSLTRCSSSRYEALATTYTSTINADPILSLSLLSLLLSAWLSPAPLRAVSPPLPAAAPTTPPLKSVLLPTLLASTTRTTTLLAAPLTLTLTTTARDLTSLSTVLTRSSPSRAVVFTLVVSR